MKQSAITKAVSGIFTVLVISILVLAGPANALTLLLETQKEAVNQGSTAIFRAEIQDASLTEEDVLTFTLTGPHPITCTFNKDGKEISGCEDVKIHAKEKENNFGYGYGESKTYEFLIQVKTTGFEVGEYTPELSVDSDSIEGGKFKIFNPPTTPKKPK